MERSLGERVYAALEHYLENTKKTKADVLKKLKGSVVTWIRDDPRAALADGSVTFSVLRSTVMQKYTTKQGNFDLYNVKKGLLGLGTATSEGNRIKFVLSLAKIEAEGGVAVDPKTFEKRLHEKHLFNDEQRDHRADWRSLGGIDVQAAIPDGFGPQNARRVHVGGAFLGAVNTLREKWDSEDCPNRFAVQATRAAWFALAFDSNTSKCVKQLRSFYGFFHNFFQTLLAEAAVLDGKGLPYIEQLTANNCDAFIWRMVEPVLAGKDPSKVPLRTRLDQLAHQDNLLALLGREIGLTNPADVKRIEMLNYHKEVVKHPITPQLQHWIGVLVRDNKSRMNKYKRARDDAGRAKVQPPHRRASSGIGAFPLVCARKADLINFFVAFGFSDTTVRGVLRTGCVGRGGDSYQQVLSDLSKMSTEADSRLQGECTLIYRPQMHGVGGEHTKDLKEGRFFYKQDYVIVFTTRAAPVMPWPLHCLGGDGVGPAVSIDLGGHQNTTVHVSQPGLDPTELQFEATEHCKGLNHEIIRESVKWKRDLSLAAQSRAERLMDPHARGHFQKLNTMVSDALPPQG